MALERKALILAKIEGTYGVDPTPTPAANAVLIMDPVLRVDGKVLTRSTLDASLSRRPHVMGRKLVQFSFGVELKGSGTAATPPDYSPLLRACQMSETIAADVQYKFVDAAFESCAIYFYNDELLHKILGCYGTWDLSAPAGEFGRINFQMTGLWSDVTTVAIPGGAVYDATKPPMVQSATLTLGGFAGVIQAFTLAANVGVDERPDLNSPEGLKGLVTNRREVTGSVNPEVVPIATHDFWGNFKAGTEVALLATFGSVAGNRIKISSAPKVQYGVPAYGARSGLRTFELPIMLNRNLDAGGDELIIAHD